jgi:hypothetical protein
VSTVGNRLLEDEQLVALTLESMESAWVVIAHLSHKLRELMGDDEFAAWLKAEPVSEEAKAAAVAFIRGTVS